jgi:ferredoxin
MIVRVDKDRCVMAGNCMFKAPNVFTQDDDGFVEFLTTEVTPEDAEGRTMQPEVVPAPPSSSTDVRRTDQRSQQPVQVGRGQTGTAQRLRRSAKWHGRPHRIGLEGRMSRHGDEHLYPGLDPPLGAISVQETSQTRTRLRQLPALGVSMLTLNHALLASQLAGHEAERFAGVAITASLSGAVYIEAGCLHR